MTIKSTPRMIAKIALPILKQLKADYAEYLDECERDWKAGYRSHYCFHGTNNWTDYDNICGPCEDGYSLYDMALWRAHSAFREWNTRCDWVMTMPCNIPAELRDQLVDWSLEALKG